MKKIKSNYIFQFLKDKNVSFEVKGDFRSEYRLASIFDPITNGFYFIVKGAPPSQIEDSLLLTNSDKTSVEKDNCLVLVNSDPQKIYYSILRDKFSEKSNGVISNSSSISEDAEIRGNVQIDPFCVVGDNCVIGDGAIIGSHSVIHEGTTIGEEVVIGEQSSIGASGMAWTWDEDGKEKIVQPQLGGVTIEDQCRLGAHSVVVRGSLSENTFIGEATLIAPGVRLGHGTRIGSHTHLANDVTTGGNTRIGEYCFVGSSAVFRPKVQVADYTIIGAGAVVVRDTTEQERTLMGVPAEEYQTKEHPSGMPKPPSPKSK
jgi:UDP-3-O-[3-hydroxymyristoyl] glucosamine N-acyltransferase